MNKIIVGNWKMSPNSVKETENLLKEISLISKKSKNIDIIACPPFPFLPFGKKITSFHIGAQNVSEEIDAANTGDVSTKMLKSLNISHVIVGHSERRKKGDTNSMINRKIAGILKEKMFPILCVGESVRDTNGEYLIFIKSQIHECLAQIPKAQIKNIIIAYEPIWAIGSQSQRVATTEEFVEIRIFIKKVLSDMYDIKTANSVPILYGGSVHPDNSKSFIDSGADGLLVGRDSLSAKKFGEIINSIKQHEINQRNREYYK